MKHRITALLPLCLSLAALLAGAATSSYSQNLPFQATYGDSLNEQAAAVIATQSGGHIMVGTVETNDPTPLSDIYVVKISPCGEIEWKKRYDIAPQDRGSKIRQISDGSYLVMGNSEVVSPCQNRLDIVLMKIDSIGDVQWARTYGGADFDIGTDLQIADPQAGHAIIVGNTASFGNGGIDGIILYIGTMGDVVWGKTLGGTNNDHFTSCAMGLNGEIIVAGLTLSGPTPGAGKLLLTKFLLPFGNVVAPFPMVYGNGMDWMSALSVIRLSNGQILMAGNRRVGETTGAYMLHTQSNGTYINDRMFSAGPGSYMEFQELREEPAPANSFAATGVAVGVPGGFGSADVYFAETDLMLNPTVQMLHGGTGEDVGRSITRSSTGPGHTIAGYTTSFGFGGMDMYAIQQNTLAVSGCHDAIPLVQTSTPRLTGSPLAMQLSAVKVGCTQEVGTSVYGERQPLCDECTPEELRAPGDPDISSLAREVRTTDMKGR